MLVLSRRRGEKIMIDDDIVIEVVSIQADKVRIGIDAPTTRTIHRAEVYLAIQRERGAARDSDGSDDATKHEAKRVAP